MRHRLTIILVIVLFSVCITGPALAADIEFFAGSASKPATEELSVQQVEVTAVKTKGVNATPIARVQIVNDNGPLTGITVYGNWAGITESNYNFKGGPPDADGWVTVEGPTFKNKGSGEIIFTVSTVRKVDAVYDPRANSAWTWPEKPSGSRQIPISF